MAVPHSSFDRRSLLGVAVAASALGPWSIANARLDASSITLLGTRGYGQADDTDALNAALSANRNIAFPAGEFRLTAPLRLQSGHFVSMTSATVIRQYRPNTPIFAAQGQGDITIKGGGALLWGEGAWSPQWTGNGGHDDRGIFLIACNQVRIDDLRIRNCGHSGVALIGGVNIRLNNLIIEGTHRWRTPIPREGNFQMGIYLKHDPVFGAVDDVIIVAPDISGVAQGIVSELEVGASSPVVGIDIIGAKLHDIPGQHGFYLQAGNTRVIDPQLARIALSGVKIQAGDANAVLENVTATGVRGEDIGSQLFEVATAPPFTGRVRNLILEGKGTRVGRGIGITRRVESVKATIVVEKVSDAGVQLNGPDLRDIDITLTASDVGGDGVVVYATRSSGLRIRATVRNANRARGPIACGIRVESASADVELINPDVTDANGRMHYGLFNAIAGSRVRITGKARFTGASDTAVRATGTIGNLPTTAVLQGRNGKMLGAANITRR